MRQGEVIRPHAWTLEGFFTSSYLAPADIQRDYQWTESQARDLLADLSSHLETHGGPSAPYFLGALVVTGPPPRLDVYDGLQRSTTLTILMAVLRDWIHDDNQALASRLHACIMDRDGAPRLSLPQAGGRGPGVLLSAIQPEGATLAPIKGGSGGRRIAVRNIRNLFSAAVESYSPVVREALALQLLEQTHIVALLIEGRPLAQKVFETINMRGLAVAPHDLIKGRLSQMARPDQADAIMEQWEAVRQGARGFSAFVDTIADDTLNFPNRSRRPAAELLVEGLRERSERTNGLSNWMDRVTRLRVHWNAVESVAKRGVAPHWAERAYSPLLPLWPLGESHWRVLALQFAAQQREQGLSEDWLAGMFDLLQRRVMGLRLASLPHDERRQIYKRALNEARLGQSPFDGALALQEDFIQRRIRVTLMRPIAHPVDRRILLKWIEAQGARKSLAAFRADDSAKNGKGLAAEVEHILPLNAGERREWTADFPDEQQRALLPNRLGNLLLVPQQVNRDLGRKSWTDKRAILKRAARQHPHYTLIKEAARLRQWTPEVIEQRTEAMAARVWTLLMIDGHPPFDAGAVPEEWLEEDTVDPDLEIEEAAVTAPKDGPGGS